MSKYDFIIFTINVAMRVANIPDQIKSGLFLMKRSIIAQAVIVSPRKVRFAQIKGLIYAPKEFIPRKIDLFNPVKRTNAKQSRNTITNIRLILYADFIILSSRLIN